MYSSVYSALRLFWKGGREIRRHLDELEETQWLSPDEVREWQFRKVRDVVGYAYEHVPYYRRVYGSLGIHPEDIRNFADFERLPVLTREDVQRNLDDLVSPEWQGKVTPNSTGGSTGEPVRFYVEDSYHWWDWALELRGRGWYGARQGDRIGFVWGAQRDMNDWDWRARLKAGITRERYLNAFCMTKPKMEEFARTLVRWRPVMLRAYASALSIFADYLEERGIGGIRPLLIETTAEKLTAPQRKQLERAFRCKVADWYSAREFGTIGYQCPSGGMHICETSYLEVLAGRRPARLGELGEVAVTSLHQFAMPFIRYMIGDVALPAAGTCGCGRGLPLVQEIVGKDRDYLMTSDGRFIHGGYCTQTFSRYPEVSRYQVYQPDSSRIEVRLVLRKLDDSGWLPRLKRELQDQFGEKTQIDIQVVDQIELTRAGKHRYVISEVRPNASYQSPPPR